MQKLVRDAPLADERDGDERYGLTWKGKRAAQALALAPTSATLRPDRDESVDWDTTANRIIEGDNLDVLKLLQAEYAAQVKLVHIDPPYNTGGNFVYADDFRGRDGVHTDWLNMIYPRLVLARDLLREDGAMIVHIDEHEHANLHAVLAEIFGEENLLGVAVWDKRNPKGDATGLAYQHESIFFVARNRAAFVEAGGLRRKKKNADMMLAKARSLLARLGKVDLPADLKDVTRRYALPETSLGEFRRPIDLARVNEEFADWVRSQNFSGGEAAYNKIDAQGRVYRLVSMAWPNKKRAPDDYFLAMRHPVTGEACPVPKRGWRNPPETMRRLIEAGEIVFGPDHKVQPQRKYLLEQNMDENVPSVIAYGGSDDALLAELGIPFDTPKPVELVRDLIASVLHLHAGGLVLDFFAGSGTLAHAVMLHNAGSGDRASYILVQAPEMLDASSRDQKAAASFCDALGRPRNVAELTKERVRRAGAKLRNGMPAYEGDVGFRVLKATTPR
ncbi:MAG: methylase family protein [Rhodospirillales bacterium]|nr:methylase family protein [Rhodospirillales bacterium]